MEDEFRGYTFPPLPTNEEPHESQELEDALNGRIWVPLDDDDPPTRQSTSQGPSNVVQTSSSDSGAFGSEEGFLTTPPSNSVNSPNEHHHEQPTHQIHNNIDTDELDFISDEYQRNFIQSNQNYSGEPTLSSDTRQRQEQNVPGEAFAINTNQSDSFLYHLTPPHQQVQNVGHGLVSGFDLMRDSAYENDLGQCQGQHNYHGDHMLNSINLGQAPVPCLDQFMQNYQNHVYMGNFNPNINPMHTRQQDSFTEPGRFRQPTPGRHPYSTDPIAVHLQTDMAYNQGSNPSGTNYQSTSQDHGLNPGTLFIQDMPHDNFSAFPNTLPDESNLNALHNCTLDEQSIENIRRGISTQSHTNERLFDPASGHIFEEQFRESSVAPNSTTQVGYDLTASMNDSFLEEDSFVPSVCPSATSQNVFDQTALVPEQQMGEETFHHVEQMPTSSSQNVIDYIPQIPEQTLSSTKKQEIPSTSSQDVIDQLTPVLQQRMEEESSEHVEDIPTASSQDVIDQLTPVLQQRMEEESSEHVEEIPSTSSQDVIDQLTPAAPLRKEQPYSNYGVPRQDRHYLQELPDKFLDSDEDEGVTEPLSQNVMNQPAKLPEQLIEEESSEHVEDIPPTSSQDVVDQLTPVLQQRMEEESSEHVEDIPTASSQDVIDQLTPVLQQRMEEESSEHVEDIPTASSQDVIDQLTPVLQQRMEEESSEHVEDIPTASSQDVIDQLTPVLQQRMEEESSEHVEDIPTASSQDEIDQLTPVLQQRMEEESSEHVESIPSASSQDVIDQLTPALQQRMEEESSEHVEEIPSASSQDVIDQLTPVLQQRMEEESSEHVEEIPSASSQDVIDQLTPVLQQRMEEESSEHVEDIPTASSQDVIEQLTPVLQQRMEEESSEHVEEIPSTSSQDVIDQLTPAAPLREEQPYSNCGAPRQDRHYLQELPDKFLDSDEDEGVTEPLSQDVINQPAKLPEQLIEEESSEHVEDIPTVSSQDVVDQLTPVLQQRMEEESSEHVEEIPSTSSQDVVDQLTPVLHQRMEEESSEHVEDIPTASSQDVVDQLTPVLQQRMEEESSEHVEEIPSTSSQDVIDQLTPVLQQRMEEESSEHVEDIPTASSQDVVDQLTPVLQQRMEEESSEHVEDIPTASSQDVVDQLTPVLQQRMEEESSEHVEDIPTASSQDEIDQLTPVLQQRMEEKSFEHVEDIPTASSQDVIDQLTPVLQQRMEEESSEHVEDIPTASSQDVIDQLTPAAPLREEQPYSNYGVPRQDRHYLHELPDKFLDSDEDEGVTEPLSQDVMNQPAKLPEQLIEEESSEHVEDIPIASSQDVVDQLTPVLQQRMEEESSEHVEDIPTASSQDLIDQLTPVLQQRMEEESSEHVEEIPPTSSQDVIDQLTPVLQQRMEEESSEHVEDIPSASSQDVIDQLTPVLQQRMEEESSEHVEDIPSASSQDVINQLTPVLQQRMEEESSEHVEDIPSASSQDVINQLTPVLQQRMEEESSKHVEDIPSASSQDVIEQLTPVLQQRMEEESSEHVEDIPTASSQDVIEQLTPVLQQRMEEESSEHVEEIPSTSSQDVVDQLTPVLHQRMEEESSEHVEDIPTASSQDVVDQLTPVLQQRMEEESSEHVEEIPTASSQDVVDQLTPVLQQRMEEESSEHVEDIPTASSQDVVDQLTPVLQQRMEEESSEHVEDIPSASSQDVVDQLTPVLQQRMEEESFEHVEDIPTASSQDVVDQLTPVLQQRMEEESSEHVEDIPTASSQDVVDQLTPVLQQRMEEESFEHVEDIPTASSQDVIDQLTPVLQQRMEEKSFEHVEDIPTASSQDVIDQLTPVLQQRMEEESSEHVEDIPTASSQDVIDQLTPVLQQRMEEESSEHVEDIPTASSQDVIDQLTPVLQQRMEEESSEHVEDIPIASSQDVVDQLTPVLHKRMKEESSEHVEDIPTASSQDVVDQLTPVLQQRMEEESSEHVEDIPTASSQDVIDQLTPVLQQRMEEESSEHVEEIPPTSSQDVIDQLTPVLQQRMEEESSEHVEDIPTASSQDVIDQLTPVLQQRMEEESSEHVEDIPIASSQDVVDQLTPVLQQRMEEDSSEHVEDIPSASSQDVINQLTPVLQQRMEEESSEHVEDIPSASSQDVINQLTPVLQQRMEEESSEHVEDIPSASSQDVIDQLTPVLQQRMEEESSEHVEDIPSASSQDVIDQLTPVLQQRMEEESSEHVEDIPSASSQDVINQLTPVLQQRMEEESSEHVEDIPSASSQDVINQLTPVLQQRMEEESSEHVEDIPSASSQDVIEQLTPVLQQRMEEESSEHVEDIPSASSQDVIERLTPVLQQRMEEESSEHVEDIPSASSQDVIERLTPVLQQRMEEESSEHVEDIPTASSQDVIEQLTPFLQQRMEEESSEHVEEIPSASSQDVIDQLTPFLQQRMEEESSEHVEDIPSASSQDVINQLTPVLQQRMEEESSEHVEDIPSASSQDVINQLTPVLQQRMEEESSEHVEDIPSASSQDVIDQLTPVLQQRMEEESSEHVEDIPSASSQDVIDQLTPVLQQRMEEESSEHVEDIPSASSQDVINQLTPVLQQRMEEESSEHVEDIPSASSQDVINQLTPVLQQRMEEESSEHVEDIPSASSQDVIEQLTPVLQQRMEEESSEHVEDIPSASSQDVIEQLIPVLQQRMEEESSEHVEDIPTASSQDVIEQLTPVLQQRMEEESSEHVEDIPSASSQDVIEQLTPVLQQRMEEESSEHVEDIPSASSQDVIERLTPVLQQRMEEESSEHVEDIPTASSQDVIEQLTPFLQQRMEKESSEHVEEIPSASSQDVIDQLTPGAPLREEQPYSNYGVPRQDRHYLHELPDNFLDSDEDEGVTEPLSQNVMNQPAKLPEQLIEEESSEHVEDIPTASSQDVLDQLTPVLQQRMEEESSEHVEDIPTASSQDVVDQLTPVLQQRMEEESSEHVEDIPTASSQDVVDQLTLVLQQRMEEESSEHVEDIRTASSQDVVDQLTPAAPLREEQPYSNYGVPRQDRHYLHELPDNFLDSDEDEGVTEPLSQNVMNQPAKLPEQLIEEESSEHVEDIPTASSQDVVDQLTPVLQQRMEEESSEHVEDIPSASSQDVIERLTPVLQQRMEEESSEHVEEIPTASSQDVIDQLTPVLQQRMEEESSEHVEEIPSASSQDVIERLTPVLQQRMEEESSEHVEDIPSASSQDVIERLTPVLQQRMEEESSEHVEEIPSASSQDVIERLTPVLQQRMEEESSEHVEDIPSASSQDVIERLTPVLQQRMEEESSEHVEEIPSASSQDVIERLTPVLQQRMEEESSEHVEEIPSTSSQDVIDQLTPVLQQRMEEESSEHVEEIPSASSQDVLDQLTPVLQQRMEEESSEHVEEIPSASSQDVIERLTPVLQQRMEEESSKHFEEIPTASSQDVIDQTALVPKQHMGEETFDFVEQMPTSSSQNVIDYIPQIPEQTSYSNEEPLAAPLGDEKPYSNFGIPRQDRHYLHKLPENILESDEDEDGTEPLSQDVIDQLTPVLQQRMEEESSEHVEEIPTASSQDVVDQLVRVPEQHKEKGTSGHDSSAPIHVNRDEDEQDFELRGSGPANDGGPDSEQDSHRLSDEGDVEAEVPVPNEVDGISSDENDGEESEFDSDVSISESDDEQVLEEMQPAPIEVIDIGSDADNDEDHYPDDNELINLRSDDDEDEESELNSDHSSVDGNEEAEQLESIEAVDIDSDEDNDRVSELNLDQLSGEKNADQRLEKEHFELNENSLRTSNKSDDEDSGQESDSERPPFAFVVEEEEVGDEEEEEEEEKEKVVEEEEEEDDDDDEDEEDYIDHVYYDQEGAEERSSERSWSITTIQNPYMSTGYNSDSNSELGYVEMSPSSSESSDYPQLAHEMMGISFEIEEEERYERMRRKAFSSDHASFTASTESNKRKRVHYQLDEFENEHHQPSPRRTSEPFYYNAEHVDADDTLLSDDEIQVVGPKRRIISKGIEPNLALQHSRSVQEVAVARSLEQQKTRQGLPPPVKKDQEKTSCGNEYLNPNKNYKTRKMVEIVHDDVRPVIYRHKNLSSEKFRAQNAKRKRVTRQVAQHIIPQFHEENEDTTEFRNVRETNVIETVDSYLEEAQKLVQKSESFYDQMIPAALEYDNSIKVLNFGLSMKKLSCKQKQMKFQFSWWEREQELFQKNRSGLFPKPSEPSYSINEDPILFQAHFLMRGDGASQLEKVSEPLINRLTKRRAEDDVILDSSYFVREFFMTKSSISFRINRSSDIPELFVPPTSEAGYFPHSALTIGDRMHYLASRYEEAQMEYFSLTYTDIEPPRGFRTASVTYNELYNFHCMGKHIHGFFVCWESIGDEYVDHNCRVTPKRFLVDMFFKIPFPLHADYETWDTRLKLAFDRLTVYLLHLAEVCRMNRPVFDKLARNKRSFHKSITFEEIVSMLTERNIDIVSFINHCGPDQFYNFGLAAANESYLSAFMIICGGTKVMKPIDTYDLGKTTVLNSIDQGIWLQRADGGMEYCEDLDGERPTEVLVQTDIELEESIEQTLVPKPIPKKHKRVSRLICDLDVDDDEVDEVPRKSTVLHDEEEQSRPTRKELIDIRRQLYNLPTPPQRKRRRSEERQKKKPGRKPETLLARGLKTNDFECSYLPSDAESDYEGYLSESEDITEKVPTLTRTQSSDSIFLDMTYKDYRFNRVSYFHQCCIHRPKHPIAKLKRRKMNRITQKHSLRYRLLEKKHLAFKEMMECYYGNLPCLADEVARTKNCIRNPHKHKKLNVPRVFSYGDAELVDICSNVLKEAVAHTVAFQNASIGAGEIITRELQETRVERRRLLETLPKKLNPRLPSFDYLAMEFFFLRHVKSRHVMTLCIESLKQFTQRCTYFAVVLPKYLRMYHMRMQFVEREDYEFEEFLKTQRKRKRHLDRTRKEILIENRSYQAEVMKDHQRRLDRREHAEKVAARAKLPPEERAKLAEEDKKNKEARENDKARLKAIQMEMKETKTEIITSRLRREAEDRKKNDAEEAKLRYLHCRRLEDMYSDAKYEKGQLLTEYRKLEEIRQARLEKQQTERKEAERKKLEMRAKLAEERRKKREAEERKIREEKEKKEREAEKRRLEAAERRRIAEELRKQELEKKRVAREMATRQRLGAERLKKLREMEDLLLKAMLESRRNKLEGPQKKHLAEQLRLKKLREAELKKQLDEELARKRMEERLKEIRAKRLREYQEKKKRKLEEKLIREREEKRIKALEKERVRKLEEERRQKIEEAISFFRARILLAEFTKEVRSHIERNREITLLMCSEDKENKYETAKQAFKTAKCDELLEKVVPQFVAAYKAISDWDKIRKYLINFSDPTIATISDIPQCFQQFAKNIVSGFVYKKGEKLERKWFFLGNMRTLFHNIEPDMRTRFIDKITELCAPLVLNQNLLSVHPSICPALLHTYLVHSVFRRHREISIERNGSSVQPGTLQSLANHRKSRNCKKIREISNEDNLDNIVFSKFIHLPESSCSPFWKLVNLWLHCEKLDGEVKRLEGEILAYATRNSAVPSGSIQWIFPVLGACYTVIVKNHKLRETAERILLERKIEYSLSSNECLDKITDQLILMGCYFQEAMCSPENLSAMFEHNGFYLVVRMLSKLIRLIFQLMSCFNLPKFMKKETTIDDALSVVFKEIEHDFKILMIGNWRMAADKVFEMTRNVDDTIFHIQASTDGSQVSSREEPDMKIKTMGTWVHWIKIHFESRIQKTIEKALMKAIRNYHYHYVEHQEDDYDYAGFNESMNQDRSACLAFDDDSDLEIIQDGQENIEGHFDDSTVLVSGRKRSKHARCSIKKPRTDSPEDTNFPTRLPIYTDPFIQQVFRTIEVSFHNLSLHNREQLKKHLHEKFDQKHLTESLYRFHMMEKKSDEEYRETSHCILRHDRYNWSQYRRHHMEFNQEDARSAENTFLCLFDHIAVIERDFRKLKWEVPRKNGLPIQPIEFFSNLKWYRSRDWYDNNIVDNSLPFFFRVYHHIWFMGALAPRCYSANSHETVPNGWCGGCTYGDVIIIPDCTCENHREAQCGNFCYTRTKLPLEDTELTVDRLLGRFVCEHGPSSCLVLDYSEPPQNESNQVGDEHDSDDQTTQVDRKWKPFSSRYTSFKSSLNVENIDFIYENIVNKIPFHSDGLETTVDDEDDFWFTYAPRLLELRKSRNQVKVAKPNLRRRTKSEEAPIRQKHNDIRYFNRVVSSMDLTEINKYVTKKWNYARRAISPMRKIVKSEYDIPPSFDQKEFSSLENILSGTNHSSNSQRFKMIAAMLECGFHNHNNDVEEARRAYFTMFNYYYEKYGLLQMAGEPIKEKETEKQTPIPMVAKLHKEFLTFKESWMEDARKSLITVKDIGNEEKYESFKKLTNCYMEIFRFNLYMFRLYLDTVEFRIFNCYAVYEAEKKKDVSFIKEGIQRVNASVSTVSSAFFNERPLIRQLDQLCQIKNKHTREEMNCYVASLCRYAITRVRVPAIADKNLNSSAWVNFTKHHDCTITVTQLSIQKTIPPEFEEEEYLEKLRQRGFKKHVFKQIMNSFHDAKIEVARTVLLALNYQFYDFFEVIRTLMPTGLIDPIMRAYYGQQIFLNAINVLYRKTHYLTEKNCRLIGTVHTSLLITGLVERGKQRRNLSLKYGLNNMLVETSKYKAVPLPIHPSTIGVSFVCFEKKLFISVVRESNIRLDQNECFTREPLKIPEHQEMVPFNRNGQALYVIVDKRNGELSICFPFNKGPYQGDQFVVKAKLHKSYFIPEIDWESILKYFNGRFNSSDHFLNTQPFATLLCDMIPLGGLELRPRITNSM